MFRRLIVILLVVTMFLASGMTAYAGSVDGDSSVASNEATTVTTPDEDAAIEAQAEKDAQAAFEAQVAFDKMLADIIKDQEAVNTDQFLVNITMPETQTDSTYEKSYVISGIAIESDVRVCLAKYNEETKVYEALENTDGKSSWVVAKGNAFSKEILLSKESDGINKIKIVAYSTSGESVIEKNDIQVNSFTISLLNKTIKTVIKDIKNGINDFKNNLPNFLGGNN